jgi:hypothetical protein
MYMKSYRPMSILNKAQNFYALFETETEEPREEYHTHISADQADGDGQSALK